MAATFGRYELLRKVGRGGMAEVFLARVGEDHVAKLLAIKRLLPAYSRNQRLVQRLAAEARLTVWLTHPNIVQVFDFGKVADSYFIAMEFVDGCDLRSLIQPPGSNTAPIQLPLEVALDVGYRILDALRFAHTCADATGKPLGIIHRDVSPHNVLISRDGHPKLADFGIARIVSPDHHTQPGAVLGKFSYMAPEQARGEDYDARVDIYAAGATLYQMLTGNKPFPERAAVDAVKNELPPPPSSLRPSIPGALDTLVLKAMAPRPEDRFGSAAQLADVLLEQLQVLGGPPKPHQICGLVEEVLEQRRERADKAQEEPKERATLSDFIVETRNDDSSLIGEEVTRVQQHFLPNVVTDVADKLPVTDAWHDQTEPASNSELSVELEPADLEPDDPVEPEEPGEIKPATPAQPAQAAPLSLPTAPLSRGMRLWVVGGLATSAALVIFGVGLLVGRATVPDPPACPTPPGSAQVPTVLPLSPKEHSRVKLSLGPPSPDPKRVLPASAEVVDTPPAKDKTSPPPRRRRRVHRPRRSTRPKPRPIDEDEDEEDPARVFVKLERAKKTLKAAQQAYVEGNHRTAIKLARQALHLAPGNMNAWQIIGGSSCYLRQRAGAQQALSHVNEARRGLIRSICSRGGIQLGR